MCICAQNIILENRKVKDQICIDCPNNAINIKYGLQYILIKISVIHSFHNNIQKNNNADNKIIIITIIIIIIIIKIIITIVTFNNNNTLFITAFIGISLKTIDNGFKQSLL